ncbi:hypothetical protein AB5I39_01460 [Sphingomonas sp. MMS24-J45]|uniref:hypothetical protein n=1 Tax=Sphingomonas sp. MMS24-J45 TaxID=3238806 RepID=UPI00384FF991
MTLLARVAPHVSPVEPAGEHFDYFVFGLRVRSEIRLNALTETAIAAPDVEIRVGSIAAHSEREPFGLYVGPDGAVLNIADVGRFLIANGNEITVAPHPKAPARNVELFLLGSAFAAVLHHRRLLPLHANAIEIDGRAIAFMGHSGAGKSTLAAWFADRGFRVLSDDVCVVDFDPAGVAYASAGIPRLRLWKDALNVKGISEEGLLRSFDGQDKYDLPIRFKADQKPVKLDSLYVLGRIDQPTTEPVIQPIHGTAAIEAISTNTYRGAYIPMIGDIGTHIKSCISLADSVSIRTFNRCWDHRSFDHDANHLLQIARSQMGKI